MSESHFEVEAGIGLSLQKLSGITGEIGHCNCNTAGNCLNISLCAYTTGIDQFTVSESPPLPPSFFLADSIYPYIYLSIYLSIYPSIYLYLSI